MMTVVALALPRDFGTRLARALLAAGAAAGMVGAVLFLPLPSPLWRAPFRLADVEVALRFSPAALWLLLFGLAPAMLACALASPLATERGRKAWLFGAALTLLGAWGVFCVQDALSFLICWEVMSLGGGVLLLAENPAPRTGRSTLFMLVLLEVGAVALLAALLLLGRQEGPAFSSFTHGSSYWIGLFLLVGFGAKLGCLPFYEWFPAAYGSGSGASGALLSGVVLNAAFFGLNRGLLRWLPTASVGLGTTVIAVAVISAILAALYAFQQDDWRQVLGFSSAENANLAVAALGAAILFRAYGLPHLAALAMAVGLIQMAAHALAKGAMFLTADGAYLALGGYDLRQAGLLRRAPVALGIGAVFAAMSLSAMPPQAGFVSEWYLFQTVFQGFHLPTLFGRLALATAGAGIALTAAVSLATWVKVTGIGLLGAGRPQPEPARGCQGHAVSVLVLGGGVLALAVGMPWWLSALGTASQQALHFDAPRAMRSGWLLVPLTAHFAFISPTLLAIVAPLLALLPLLLLLGSRRPGRRRVPVWYGGLQAPAGQAATTSLAFSNALRTFYGFVYSPTHEVSREYRQEPYFVHRLTFNENVAPIFGRWLFRPTVLTVRSLARGLRWLQSGRLNLYAGWIGLLLLAILLLTILR
jgi:hydrogenase-4 component B